MSGFGFFYSNEHFRRCRVVGPTNFNKRPGCFFTSDNDDANMADHPTNKMNCRNVEGVYSTIAF